MPDITSSGTVTKSTTGNWKFLGWKSEDSGEAYQRVLLFAGSSVGSSCVVQYTDDEGTDRTIANGTITSLPTSITIAPIKKDLKIVTTGSPNFNVTPGA